MSRTFKDFYAQFSTKAIVLSLMTGLLLALFIMVPIIAILINLWFLFIYRIYLVSTGIVLALAGFGYLFVYLFGRTLFFYRQTPQENDHKVIVITAATIGGIIFIIGLTLMLILIPTYL